jgi:acyl-coenzyme A thioesterase PaaI-like protein
MGFVHGGAFSTLVDVATTLAILKVDPEYRKTVSVDLGLHFLSPVKFDENILI